MSFHKNQLFLVILLLLLSSCAPTKLNSLNGKKSIKLLNEAKSANKADWKKVTQSNEEEVSELINYCKD